MRLRAIGLALLLSAAPAAAQAPQANQAPQASQAPHANLIPPSPRIGGIKLHVTDLDKAIRFYETVFQMKLFNIQGGATREAMLEFPSLPAPAQPAGTVPEPFLILALDPGFVHVNSSTIADMFIRVPDVDATRKRAADAGYAATGILKDPSGNMIELTVDHYYVPQP